MSRAKEAPVLVSNDADRSASPGAERTIAIIESLSRAGSAGQTASEIARTLELPHNSTCRIIETLQEHGYVERREEDRRFFLTGKLLDIARPRIGDKSLGGCALEPLCRLRDQVGETAQLAVRSQNRCVVIEQVPSRQPVKVMGELGFRVPLYSCAPGKAMLAALPETELNTFFREVKLKSFTPTTLSTRPALLRDFDAIRACGYSIDRSEGMEGIHCVGAAILDQNGYPIAALTVIGPAFRLCEEHFETIGRQCIESAKEIQRRVLA